ncbi:hypothetical protein glysoja_046588 [Glycine soja]|uniref:Uncharacterized protein n=1 Tax=Glycine soja TaxID=3848 RepID=A0A0B2PJV7_GLYSO|nr:hypothetical protein glysoja_046588 [Glycine soja]
MVVTQVQLDRAKVSTKEIRSARNVKNETMEKLPITLDR